MKIQETLERFQICPVLDRVLPTTHGHDFDPERFTQRERQPPGDAPPSSDELGAWVTEI